MASKLDALLINWLAINCLKDYDWVDVDSDYVHLEYPLAGRLFILNISKYINFFMVERVY